MDPPSPCFPLSLELITKPRAILVRYILSPWFVMDVLAMLPLEILGVNWISTAQEWKFIPILRLNRLIKYWKVRARPGSQFFGHLVS